MTIIKKIYRGFTLVELLVVIAIIGVLGVVIFLAINPAQQLARTRDSGRKSGVSQLGRALEAYATSNNGAYVPEAPAGSDWMQELVDAGEISTKPAASTYGGGVSACSTNAVNGYCYDAAAAVGTGPIVVYSRLESTAENSRCSTGVAYFVWSTQDARGGVVCSTTEPSQGTQTFLP